MSLPTTRLDDLRIQRAPRPETRRSIVPAILVVAGVVLIAVVWWMMRRPTLVVHTVAASAATNSVGDRTVLNASGYVTARREATVSSKVTGKVSEVLVEEGMKVAAGAVLARLDDTNVKASLRLAEAQAESARTALQETRVRLAEAEVELQRQTALRRQNVSAAAEFDRAEATAKALAARLAQQQADTTVAERAISVWQQQLDDTIIRAPFSGIVTSKNAQPGEMISPMSAGGFTRTGICTIVDMESLEIEIDVSEGYINRVEPGQPVEATLDAYATWKIPCRVIAIIPTADRSKSTVRVRVGFNQLDPRILPEMSVKVAFRGMEVSKAIDTAGVWVPRNAIQSRDGRDVVFVFQGGRLERRAVTVAMTEGDRALLRGGIAAGEQIVTDAPVGVTDGTAVREAAP